MTGTEKQIKWALDIKTELNAMVQACIDEINTDLSSQFTSEELADPSKAEEWDIDFIISRQEALTIEKTLQKYINDETSAVWFIEARDLPDYWNEYKKQRLLQFTGIKI